MDRRPACRGDGDALFWRKDYTPVYGAIIARNADGPEAVSVPFEVLLDALGAELRHGWIDAIPTEGWDAWERMSEPVKAAQDSFTNEDCNAAVAARTWVSIWISGRQTIWICSGGSALDDQQRDLQYGWRPADHHNEPT